MEYTSSGSLPDVGSQSYRPDRPDRPPRSPRHYPPPRLHLSNNEQNQSTSAQSLESYPSDYSNSGPQNGSGSSINNFAFVLAPTHSPIAPPDYYAQHHRRTQHLQSHHRTHSHTHSQPHLQIHSHTETPTSPNMISYPSPPREVYDGHNPAYSVGGSSSQSNTDTNTQNEGHPRVLYASDTHSSAGLSEPDLTPPANFNYNMNYPPERPSSTSNNSSNYAPANLGADQSGSEYPPPNSLNSVLYAPNSQPDYAPSAPKSPIEPPLDSPPDLYRRQSETAAPNIGHMPDLRLMTNSSIGVNRINSMFNTALPGGRPVFESPLVAAIDTGEIEYGDIRREDIIVHKEIGRGAFGTVLLGMWKGRTIAIKKSRAGNEELLHEAEMLQKLKHVNIIAVYGIYLDSDSSPCLVLEYCNRGNLFDLIHKGDKNRLLRANGQPAPAEDNELIPFNKLMDYSRQISSGMNYLHNDTEQDNLIHR
ncbi:hypothetical protein SARC_00249 [Sphaeroforma arctica JP610]|uniref:Protein kinase domain-containing protein n=1 Tax=Sphaeroforma arctica JP610 TaxID=667725 RepID=A0A0L0GH18_9EUKA|nr:hypothetical protein SARC_00249 [Sphaeroforma arctica JP610]KNC87618.1 hypothetical protein SARC_00249 [Sphaeroforma arctica JP610]|eukprot:XP_014161520.1 hypothetical protein SARC_00249 [Sphaeroforma arctica JP610]